MAAARFMRFENSPPTNAGRNEEAHRPKKIAVASAMMFPRRLLASTTDTMMPITMPSRVIRMDLAECFW